MNICTYMCTRIDVNAYVHIVNYMEREDNQEVLFGFKSGFDICVFSILYLILPYAYMNILTSYIYCKYLHVNPY